MAKKELSIYEKPIEDLTAEEYQQIRREASMRSQAAYRAKRGLPPPVPTGIDCSKDPVLTEQRFKEDSQIENIVKRFEKTGEIPVLANAIKQYGDFTKRLELQSALDTVIRAEEVFNAIPAKIRARFENNPLKFCEFVENPANEAALIEMGLLEPKPRNRPPGPPVASQGTLNTNVGGTPGAPDAAAKP